MQLAILHANDGSAIYVNPMNVVAVRAEGPATILLTTLPDAGGGGHTITVREGIAEAIRALELALRQ